jgi:hypothetical protein
MKLLTVPAMRAAYSAGAGTKAPVRQEAKWPPATLFKH